MELASPNSITIGVILAAGQGRRMTPLNQYFQKAALPLKGSSLIEHQAQIMASLGIKDLWVVIGHLGNQIRGILKDGNQFGLRVHYVEQSEPLGIAHALSQLDGLVNCPFLLFLGDIWFEADRLGSAFEIFFDYKLDALLLTQSPAKREAIQLNFAVYSDEDHWVKKVEEKPRFPSTDIKGCGIYLFGPKIFEATLRTARSPLRNEFELTDAIQALIESGGRVQHAPLIRNDVNFTTLADWIAADYRAAEA